MLLPLYGLTKVIIVPPRLFFHFLLIQVSPLHVDRLLLVGSEANVQGSGPACGEFIRYKPEGEALEGDFSQMGC